MNHKIIYTADLGGNLAQYEKLFSLAAQTKADSIIIGGDLAPWSEGKDPRIEQQEFLSSILPEKIKEFRQKGLTAKIYLMMGNDDAASSLDAITQQEEWSYIGQKRVQLTPDFEIYGYSFVPITPFALKDWEKFDARPKEEAKKSFFKKAFGGGEKPYQPNARLEGLKSTPTGWAKAKFDPANIESTIEYDLNQEEASANPRKTVYIFHSPPNNTNLDMINPLRGTPHAGSKAIRSFIETHQPYLTMHGHIHETVEFSHQFQDRIGNTPCMTAGNGQENPYLAVLIFDLYNVSSTVERKIIPLKEQSQ